MIKKILRSFFILTLCTAFTSALINVYIVLYAKPYMYTSFAELKKAAQAGMNTDTSAPSSVSEQSYTALVLGAMVYGNRLSTVLKDRVDAGLTCYRNGKTDGFCTSMLLSGDHGKKWYDEVNAMRLYVLRMQPNIDKTRIFLDHAGFDTYDSLYRAKTVFKAKNVIVVTQRFHSYRAVYIGRKLGLRVYALALNEDKYHRRLRQSWAVREYFARIKAFADTTVQRKSRFAGEPIPVNGSSLKTWDIFETE